MKKILYCFFFFLMGISSAYANSDIENEDLNRVVTVLNSLTPLINTAKAEQDKTTRVQFRYDILQSDIDKIKSGIQEKIFLSPYEPRVIKPITGDYLVMKNSVR